MANAYTTKVVKEDVVVRLNDEELVKYISPLIFSLGYRLDEVDRIYVKVPGGGDWSNTDMDISKDCLLFVHIKRETKG